MELVCNVCALAIETKGGGLKSRHVVSLVLALLLSGAATFAAEENLLLAQQRTLNKSSVVFVYGGYLWSVPRGGGEARQFTTGGHESDPSFSPDGQWIAFSGNYDG